MKEVTLSLAITISKLESDKLVLNKRIAELEEMVSVLAIADETGYVDGYGFIVDFNKITDEARKFLAAHNFEQKAEICELLAQTTYTDTAHGQSEQFRLYQMARSLREQAKQLKGGAE
jgi:hypothetical protein